MRVLMFLAVAMLSACNPVTDAQVAAVIEQCKALGLAARVFNGVTSFAECVPVNKAGGT